MRFRFDFDKTLQAAAHVLRSHNRQMEYMRLLKILYIADRELLSETGRTLTGDWAAAMKHGPVLSHTYDAIKSKSPRAGEWDSVVHREGHRVELRADPGEGKLSRGEAGKLTELCDRYRDVDTFDLSELTHSFEEWQKAWSSKLGAAVPIEWANVLMSQGKEKWVPEIERSLQQQAVFDAVFGVGR